MINVHDAWYKYYATRAMYENQYDIYCYSG